MGMETLIELILKDVEASKSDAATVPISSERDRITVTEEVSKRIGKYTFIIMLYQKAIATMLGIV